MHDFKRDGARTIWKHRVGPFFCWAEESAAWHLARSAHYGVNVWSHPGTVTLRVGFGRWSVSLSRDAA